LSDLKVASLVEDFAKNKYKAEFFSRDSTLNILKELIKI